MRTSHELRKKNVLEILKTITQNPIITKNDVANKTGFTIVTINTVINHLLKKGILVEDGIADSIGGRPASRYKLNSSRYYMIGINIGIDEFSMQITDLSMKEVYRSNIDLVNGEKFESILKKLKNMLFSAMEKLNIRNEDILGMGVTVPGPVDKESGLVHFLPNVSGWENIQLKQIFETEFDFKIFIEKDTYASVLCLKRQFDFELKSAIILILKGGIGSGILQNGSIYRGENGIAGEFGHMSLEMNGPVCKCGNVGCLEVYASDIAIVSEVTNRLIQNRKSIVENFLEKNGDKIDIDLVIKAANLNDEVCKDVLLTASKYVGTAISNIIKAYDPLYIVIESKWIKEVDGMLEAVVNTCRQRSTLLQMDKVNIVLNNENDLYLTGAVLLVHDYFMNSINDNILLD